MIELKQVTKRYGRKGAGPDALREVTLAVPAGAVWAVVGPNGAGKSTLLSLLLGFIRPTEGDITIAGDPPRHYLRRRGAAWLPERFSVPSSWRAGDALRMFARLDAASVDAAGRVSALLGLEPHLDKRIGELSRGTLQRIGLAQALLAPRDLVVLDEPTEGLDPLWRVRLRDIIAGLRADARTVVIASHDLGEIERIADRAVVLDAGAVRDVIEVRQPDTAAEYRITLASPYPDLGATFPGAVRNDALRYVVRVGGAAELSQRLAALLSLGAVIAAVEPLRIDLEERVRDVLGGTQ